MISGRYNQQYKVFGNEAQYPFELSSAQAECLKVGMEKSRVLIPAGAFQGSFKPVNPANVKSLYRSVDWIDWFIYVVPTLVASLFVDETIQKAILALTRACGLSLQWVVTKKEVQDIKS